MGDMLIEKTICAFGKNMIFDSKTGEKKVAQIKCID